MAARSTRRLSGMIGFALLAAAAPAGAAGLPPAAKVLPRFASLRSDEVNLRVGPGRNYPIKWVLTKKGLPVEIIAQFEHWREVREPLGSRGWIQERMLTGERNVMITGAVRTLRSAPSAASAAIARAEPGVVAKLLECRPGWCRIGAGRQTGWIRREAIFGVLPNETVIR